MQNTDVPLALFDSNFNRYMNAGTRIKPPPVEKNPLINPDIIPISANFIFFSY